MAQYASTQRARKKARSVPLLACAAFLLGAAGLLYRAWPGLEQASSRPFAVQIALDGEPPVEVEVVGGTVGEALAAAGIAVGPYDAVAPGLDEPASPGLRITVQRATPVRVQVDGAEGEHWVVASTVRDALRALGVALGSLDRVEPSLNTPLSPEMTIRVVRVAEELIEEYQTLPYKEVRWAAPDLEQGQRRVIREGREGLIKNTVRVVYEDGKPVNRTIVASEVIQPTVDRIIGEGTRPPTKYVDTPNGPLPYIDVIEMVATGYDPGPASTGIWADGLTYTGLKAQRGVAAVDPTVIPLGTRLYIPGYGEAIAADIGAAIKGNRIDLCFDTYEEAIQWGRRTVLVYILS